MAKKLRTATEKTEQALVTPPTEAQITVTERTEQALVTPPTEAETTVAGDDQKQHFIVGIGASAGGLEALRALFPSLPGDLNLSYVVVQHLSPNYRSMLAQLLSKDTSMPILEIEQDASPEPNTVYLTPANRNVTLVNGRFQLVKPAKESYPKPSINVFFNSLAEEKNDQAIGIVLSGTGSDGASGIYAIKAVGGFTFAQHPPTAKYSGMPQAAIDTGSVDWVLPPDRIGKEISLIVQAHGAIPMPEVDKSAGGQLSRLLLKVRKRTKVDFSGYKDATLWRRIARRIAATHMANLDEYLHHCETVPDELDRLARDILISVTAFFRDKEAFAGLSNIIQKLVKLKKPGEDIRVWVPACATGEEAYTIAILFAEMLSAHAEAPDLHIFATDIDLDAMAKARKGQYPFASLDSLPPNLVKRYFVRHADRYEIIKPIRDMVIFARQDLIQDPPFLRLDLVSCRNVLIYLHPDVQAKILATFHYSLLSDGILFLGKSETVAQQETLFQALDRDARIYRRIGGMGRMPTVHRNIEQQGSDISRMMGNRSRPAEDLLMRTALKTFVPPCIMVDADLGIQQVHGDAGKYLTIPDGQPNFDLGSLIRKEFRAELQILVHQVAKNGEPAKGRVRRLHNVDKDKGVQMTVHPVHDSYSKNSYLISFQIMGNARSVEKPIGNVEVNKELEDELLSTREHLQTMVEEMETSNEEMQALNEELQSANEELQSTNEELEASNEELQSTNEELSTVNEELQVKSRALEEAYVDLEDIQNGVDFPLIVLDSRGHLTRYNQEALKFFHLTTSMIGTPWKDVPMPGELPRFDSLIQEAVHHRRSISSSVSEEESHYSLHITPFLKDGEHVRGVILSMMDVSELFRVERLAREAQRQMMEMMSNATVLFALKDTSGRYQFVNHEFERITGLKAEAVIGKTDFQVFPEVVAEALWSRDLEVMQKRSALEIEESVDFGGKTVFLLTTRLPVFNEDGVITTICMQSVDISVRKYAEEQLRLTAKVFERFSEGLVVTDADNRILVVNDTFSRITGWRNEEVIGKNPSILRSHRSSSKFYAEMWEQIKQKGWWQGEIWNCRKDGTEYLEWLTITSIHDPQGKVTNYVGTFTDITTIKETKQKIEFLATHDELTHLPNRALFLDRLKTALKQRDRDNEPLALLFLDLDNFKVINDTLGHDFGDILLKQVASRLKDCVRQEDTVARLGGDEFTVIMEGADTNHAANAAERILKCFETPVELQGHPHHVSCSIGISICPDDGRDLQTLIKKADTAMYQAKSCGKSAFRFFNSQMADEAQKRLDMEHGLRQALKNKEFILAYQPQIDLFSGRILGVEALVRWQLPDGRMSPPNEFIPLAEETGLIVALGELVLEESCKQVADWRQQGIHLDRISINLSASHFLDKKLPNTVRQIIEKYQLAEGMLGIEVTESLLMKKRDDAAIIFGDLKNMGIYISIDDFGTGYSSLAYLKHYPIDELKIDRSFVDGIILDADDKAITCSILSLAHTLGMKVVAEGIETQEQLNFLKNKGCEMGQGFFIGVPMNAEEFVNWYRNYSS